MMDLQTRVQLEILLSNAVNEISDILDSQWPAFLQREQAHKTRLAYLCEQEIAPPEQYELAQQYATVEPYVTSVRQWADVIINQDTWALQSAKNLADFYRIGAASIADEEDLPTALTTVLHPRAMAAIPVLTENPIEAEQIAAILDQWLEISQATIGADL